MLGSKEGGTGRPDDDGLAGLAALKSFRFGLGQRNHIGRLIDAFGPPILWEHCKPDDIAANLIIVTWPLTGTEIESFKRSLPGQSIVVIPFGENPAFDNLKQKLAGYGTVTAAPADGPHQLWWGGLGREPTLPVAATQTPVIISGYPDEGDDAPEPHDIAALKGSLRRLGIPHIIDGAKHVMPGRLKGVHKVNLILNYWRTSNRPILWIDRNAVFTGQPSLLAGVDCDVAIHKAHGWQFSTRTLFFAKTAAAQLLLRTWQWLTVVYSGVCEDYLLDQAWSLLSSQSALSTCWLSSAYDSQSNPVHASNSTVIAYGAPEPVNEFFPTRLRSARRAGRTGFPEAQIVLRREHGSRKTLIALVEVARAVDTLIVASAVERIVDAFQRDPGDFGQLEVSLCQDKEDLEAFAASAETADSWILLLDPTRPLPANICRSVSRRIAAGVRNQIIRLPAQASPLRQRSNTCRQRNTSNWAM